ncbi:membrane protein [Parabacteroides sp. PF5-5]|uniref:YihY/virulence factor BrkB family protein n=1 Tax=unclassified Parabacteroides TaxID=2649774 RepID=UPI002476DDBE|nr:MULTISPECIES: YihY/virulence factor BrkB family protein [unclassified Parabacteroides]MDH6304309.1 membrane protein [Parabacteroides sp. PH5-39]MDH6315538.1 membrane protein [Parabacteroides sp. PF5-13]MDH6318968.1 membrane protein [Parabacteroides sp. PH5-13]MDH6322697.1 membrane protein [Parabacteroides sp. PH5-8]MDH6326731.1 membrane protein [Parabacteroides sp. PH5-41]
MKKKEDKKSIIEQISSFIKKTIYFVTYDIWRITANEVSGLKSVYINAIKTIILAIRGFQTENLQTKASALTYSTLLAIIPLLAVIVGIAKGFGFQGVVYQELMNYFPGHEVEINKALEFVESYLSQAQGGVFIGVGLILLFYTVINLISSIEDAFNAIWQVPKSRPWRRKIVSYMALFLMLPILMTVSGGFSILISTLQNTFLSEYVFFTPVVESVISFVPFIIATIVFTIIYILLPNTKVHFLNALVPGAIAGFAFQIFQMIYITGMIWVSKYNAIYGSFAALPLLLLWLQLSWLICLFGAELSYSSQNVKKFSFERDSHNISRRYKDFLTLLIASLIVKRFMKGEKPYTADELSDSYQIPLGITSQILYLLTELDIIIEVNYGDDDRIRYYQPAIDINQISVGYLFSKMDEHGSENFKIDTASLFNKEWEALLKTRKDMLSTNDKVLLKDL